MSVEKRDSNSSITFWDSLCTEIGSSSTKDNSESSELERNFSTDMCNCDADIDDCDLDDDDNEEDCNICNDDNDYDCYIGDDDDCDCYSDYDNDSMNYDFADDNLANGDGSDAEELPATKQVSHMTVVRAVDGTEHMHKLFDEGNHEQMENIDETYMPEKLRGKKWIVKNHCGTGTNFHVSQGYADGFLLAIRRRHLPDDGRILNAKQRANIEMEYQWFKEHTLRVMEKIGYHDNIVTFLGLRRVGIGWEMFMEYIPGGDLFREIARYRNRSKQMPEAIILLRFRDLARAVAYLHSRGIAHLDIKAENCLLTKWGSLKLCDFDCSRTFVPGARISNHYVGTKEYSPPERFFGSVRPECADAWACGIVLYMMIALHIPWSQANRMDVAYERWLSGENSLEFPQGTNPKFLGLINHLLDPCEDTRASMPDVVADPWIGKDWIEREKAGEDLHGSVFELL